MHLPLYNPKMPCDVQRHAQAMPPQKSHREVTSGTYAPDYRGNANRSAPAYLAQNHNYYALNVD